VSDHNNVDGAFAVREIAPFRVIVAEEIKSSEGEIIGLFLQETVRKGLSPEDTVRAIREQNGLVLIPHPFDRLRGSPLREEALLRILPDVDVIEVFNARIVFPSGNDRAGRFAREHGLAMSAASDAHSPWEVGRSYVEMADFEGPEEFLTSLREGRIVGRLSSPLVHLFTRWAWLRRKLGWRPV
jgi:predicted metal-dependent phosphoesterase TrpH